MIHPGRRRWLIGIAAVIVLGVGALFVANRRPSGYLLAADEVAAAREHVLVREELLDLAARISQSGDGDDAASRALHVRHASLDAHLRLSAFAKISLDDLRHGLQAAEDGYTADDPDRQILRGVHGTDDRKDYDQVTKDLADEQEAFEREFLTNALDVSRGVGAWMHTWSLDGDDTSSRLSDPVTLGDFWQLCAGERFSEHPKAALGTAFLVRPDIVVTAAHVLKTTPLNKLVLVFDFEIRDGTLPTQVREIYRPLRVLSQDKGDGTYDWAILLLDRAVANARVLPLARARPRSSAPVYMWGHSLGTPKKFMRGRVLENEPGSHSVRVDLDAFGGDSGSPVLNEDHEVVGVLFGGSADLAKSRGRGCRVAAKVRRGDGGEYVTKVKYFDRRIPK